MATQNLGMVGVDQSDKYGPGSPFYRLDPGTNPNDVMTYKGIADDAHPDGIYKDTYDNIARSQAKSIGSQQGFNGGTPYSAQQDTFHRYFADTPSGTSQNWAGGNLIKNADGSATFVGAGGKPININAASNMADLAAQDPGIAAQWASQYTPSGGIKTPVPLATTANPGSGALTQVQPWVNNYQPGNVMQPGQTAGGGGGAQPAQPFNWGTQQPQQGGQFNTPVLDALYQGQQQRMFSQAPTFNFQAKPGALTQAITAP